MSVKEEILSVKLYGRQKLGKTEPLLLGGLDNNTSSLGFEEMSIGLLGRGRAGGPAGVFAVRVFFLLNAVVVARSLRMPSRSRGYTSPDLRQLDFLLHPSVYDRRQTPTADTGEATRVDIEFYIRSFSSVNPVDMDYSVDVSLRQRWAEARLNNTLRRPIDTHDPMVVKLLWKPEVYFPNAKHGDFQYVTVPNVLVRIQPNGTILYILRMKLTFSCMMDLSTFPLDHQTCSMEVASFAKTTRELYLNWYHDNPVKLYRQLHLLQFDVNFVAATNCSHSFLAGNYSCLQAVFHLQRNLAYHLVQSYLPSSLIVVVSWVSFWLDADAVASRVILGVTTLFTVCSESAAFGNKLSTVSYVKALDVWMGSCTVFVFLAMVEFTLVNYIGRHRRRLLFRSSAEGQEKLEARERSDSIRSTAVGTPEMAGNTPLDAGDSGAAGTGGSASVLRESPNTEKSAEGNVEVPLAWLNEAERAKRIDRNSRVVFPLLFLVFNLGYWVYYQALR
ncbi:putative glycine receptor subunit alpha-2-like [Penaeus vannamei]|uniref:Putative glycine receptor subunit alpha-2-like n=1 Tax=Penaeus vannamei TaxID=6689 RepID=A0A3R7MJ70_PENVA|nr:putative glycine receptor subunit alpha-2-like [Penaeus vannamei]